MATTDYIVIEDAALAALESLKAEAGVRTLDAYGGEFNEEDIWQTALIFPAVMVFCSGFDATNKNRYDRQDWELVVYVADQNSRGDSAARRGDVAISANPGAFNVVSAVRVKMNRLVVTGYGPLRLTGERVIGFSKQASVCVIEARYGLPRQAGV